MKKIEDEAAIAEFAEQLHEEITRRCEESAGEEGRFSEEHYTQYMIDVLVEADQLDDGTICYYESQGIKVDGYNYDPDDDCLELFVALYSGEKTPSSVPKSEITACINRARKFFLSSVDGLYKKIPDANEAHSLAYLIHEKKRSINRVRICVFTDGLSKVSELDHESIGKHSFYYRIFDLKETMHYRSAGSERPKIEIDFKNDYGESIPCLPTVDCGADFSACVAMIPGRILCEIYAKHGSRVLERNVRSFLQARVKVNKDMKDTIIKTPERFLAYNNGISATVEEIQFEIFKGEKGDIWFIKSVKNFQIVNGGQTTASLYNAWKRYKANLNRVHVQAKISIVSDPAIMDDTVKKIAMYANSQNKISESDFYALDAFHLKMEELSRRVPAPPSARHARLTHWYYERARGAFADERSRVRKQWFKDTFPEEQRFTKTELAKYENVWAELPHQANLGDQKNFKAFTVRAGEEKITVDDQYFKDAVAMAILYRAGQEEAKKAKLPSFKTQALNLALSYVFNRMRGELELSEVWKKQAVPDGFREAIGRAVRVIHARLTESEGGKNPIEWSKKEGCWTVIKALDIPV